MLGQDPDMRHGVPTAPLLAPQPKVGERTLGRRRAAWLKNAYYTYTYTPGIWYGRRYYRRG